MRRSGRIPKQIPILLTGTDVDGRVFSEKTFTVVLSRHGAVIVSQNKLYPEQELQLRSLESNEEIEIRVVGKIGAESERFTYGVAFLNQELDFWHAEFPPLTAAEVHAGSMSLECKACRAHETLEDGGLESDILATNEAVIRYCKNCGCSTVWKEAPHVVHRESTAAAPGLSASSVFSASTQTTAVLSAPPPPSPRVNRRKHVRAKVTLTACIRQPGSGEEDIVVCEDMSRGGICFRSRKRYVERNYVEVAVPYAAGSSSIFVLAQIVRVEELAGQGFFRYGVAFQNDGSTRSHQ